MLFRGKITHTHTPQYCITVILYGRAFHKERQPRFKIISKYYLLRSVIRIENEKKKHKLTISLPRIQKCAITKENRLTT